MHARRTATSRRNSNASATALRAVAVIPAGLCAASSRIVGAERIGFEPPGRAHGGERAAHDVDVERAAVGVGAEERLDRGQRARPRSAPGARRAAAGRPRRTRRRGPAGSATGRRRRRGGRATPNSRPSRATRGLAPRRARRSSSVGGVGGLGGEDRDGVRLDDPGLLGGDLDDGVAEVLGVVEADRRDDRDLGVDDVGVVPRAAQADLDDGDVDRGVGEDRRTPARSRSRRTTAGRRTAASTRSM